MQSSVHFVTSTVVGPIEHVGPSICLFLPHSVGELTSFSNLIRTRRTIYTERYAQLGVLTEVII